MRKNTNALLLVIRSFVPALVPPKIPDGEKVDFDVSTLFYGASYFISLLYTIMKLRKRNLFTLH